MKVFHKWRIALLLFCLLSGVALFPGLQHALKIDNSLTAWFIEGDPALANYYLLQESFGNDEMVIVALESPEGSSILDREHRKSLKRLIRALERDSSVATVLHPEIWKQPDVLGIGAKLALIPKEVEKAQALLQKNDFLKDQFYSDNFEATRLYIKLNSSPDFEARRAEIIQNIYSICEAYWPAEAQHFGGLGVIYEALNELSARDFATFLGLGYILMFVLIAVLYRHWTFTLYALATVGLSAYFTLAIYGSFGLRLNLLSTLIPTIIILLGLMDVMHILNEFRKSPPGSSALDKALGALKRIWKPCLFTSLSTMAGFLSLGISPVAILAQFGLFSALGIALALFFSFLLGVLLLPLAPVPAQEDKTSQFLGQLQDWVIGSRKWILSGLALFLIASAFSLPQLSVDTDSIGYLPQDHPVRKQSDRIEALFGPYMPLDYLVKSKSLKIEDPQVQSRLEALDTEIEKIPGIGSMTGYHDLSAALKAQSQGDSSLFQFALSGLTEANPDIRSAFINDSSNLGRFYLSGELISASELKASLEEVDRRASEILGDDLEIVAAGYQSLYANIVNYVTESQLKSIALAAVLIFLLLWLFLKDLRLSAISLLPNFFPVLMLFSIMVWFGIELDTATASIASIVLSFSIDDTMHFIWHYKEARRNGEMPHEARRKTMAHVGRAIVFTSFVLFAGYALMWFGNLKTVIYFGTLTAVSILAALISQLFIFPILLYWGDVKLRKS